MTIPRQILCPTDLTESSTGALDAAIELAKLCDASVTLVHVFEAPIYAGPPFMPPIDSGPEIENAARAALDAAVVTAKTKLPSIVGVLRRGRTWEEILGAAKETNADLIVMGTHGRRGLPRAILGSVAEKVVRLSPVAVMTVRGEG
jgi:nucleotide-binding universal stress UspA family protein